MPSRNFLPPPTALETIADFSENFFFMSICLLVLIEKKVMIIILISVLAFHKPGEAGHVAMTTFCLFVVITPPLVETTAIEGEP